MIKASPSISVIMPVYNAEKYLKVSVDSVLNQTFSDLELILIDDCSPDQSGMLCDQIARTDQRVSVIHLPQNEGAGHARNHGIDAARGEYLTFVDADDSIEPGLYEAVMQRLSVSRAEVAVWGITEDYYDEKERRVFQNKLFLEDQDCQTLKEVQKAILDLEKKTIFGYQWNHLYRSDLVKKNHIYFEAAILYEDYFFNLKVMNYAVSMSVLSQTAYHYKKRMNDSITTRFVPEYFALSRRRVSEMYQLYQRWDCCTESVTTALGNIYLRYILSALCRNWDKRAGLSMKKRIRFVKKVREDDLYGAVAQNTAAASRALKVLKYCMNHRLDLICCLLGLGVYYVKAASPMLFSKIRRVR